MSDRENRHKLSMTEANRARLESFRKLSRTIKGVRWLGTLDANSCIVCAALDGASWDLDGQPLDGGSLPLQAPPLHDGCRCVLSPIPKTFRDIGLNIDEPTDEGQRASSLGPVDGKTTCEAFLQAQPEIANVVLGSDRALIFLSGGARLRDFIDDRARVIPLAQLKAAMSAGHRSQRGPDLP